MNVSSSALMGRSLLMMFWAVQMTSAATTVLVGTPQGLRCVEYDAGAYRQRDSLTLEGVRGILVTPDRKLIHLGYAGGLAAVLFDPDTGRLTTSASSGRFPLEAARALVETPAGILHVLQKQGLSCVSYDRGAGYRSGSAFLPLNTPRALVVRPDGWIITGHEQGLSVVRRIGGAYFSPPEFYQATPPVRVLVLGRENVIHVGHAGGLTAFRFDPATGLLHPTGHTWPVKGFRTFAIDVNGNLHIADDRGIQLVAYDTSAGYCRWGARLELPGITALALDAEDVLHVGRQGGLTAVPFGPPSRQYRAPIANLEGFEVNTLTLVPAPACKVHPLRPARPEAGQAEPSHRMIYRSGDTVYTEALYRGLWVARRWLTSGRIDQGAGPGDAAAFEITLQSAPSDPPRLLGADWTWQGEKRYDQAGPPQRYEVRLRHDPARLSVKVCTLADGSGALKRWLEIRNDNDHPVALRALAVWSGKLWTSGTRFTLGHALRYDNGYEGWFGWEPLKPGANCFNREKGLDYDACYFIVRNEDTGAYFFGQLAWPVSYTMEFVADEGLWFRLGPRARAALRVLAPGETVVTPAVHLAAAAADFDRIVQIMHDHIRRTVLPDRPEDQRYLIQCLMPEDRQSVLHDDAYNETNLKKVIDLAASVGAELFIVDGPTWARGYGDWVPKERWFPHGLGPLRDYAHERNLRFGLYAEPEGGRGDWTATAAWREHPEWFKTRILNLADPAAVAYMEDECRRIIENYQLDLYRHDVNVVMQGDGLVEERDGFPECAYWRHYDAFYALTRKMQQDYPQVIFQQAAGGGTRLDLTTVSVWDEHFTSDENTYPHVYRMASGFSVFLPPEILVAPNGMYPPYRQPDLITTLRGAYALGNTPMLFNEMIATGTTSQLSPSQQKLFQRYARLYKEFIRPLLGSCLVFHHAPVNARGGVESGGWFAMEFTSPDRRRGWATLIRLGKLAPPTYRLIFRGVDPARRYRVTFDNRQVTEIFPGRKLHRQGLIIGIDMQPASELLLYEALE